MSLHKLSRIMQLIRGDCFASGEIYEIDKSVATEKRFGQHASKSRRLLRPGRDICKIKSKKWV